MSSSPRLSWPVPFSRQSSSGRPSSAGSLRCVSFNAGKQRFAERLLSFAVQRAILAVAVGGGNTEHVLGTFAEGGDAGVVDAHVLVAQGLGDIGQQARPVGAD